MKGTVTTTKKKAVTVKLKTEQERIRYVFEQTGLSQKEFAAACGVGQPHFSGIMRDKKCSKHLLILIAEKTGASVDWLETGKGDAYASGALPFIRPPELVKIFTETEQLWQKLPELERYEAAVSILKNLKNFGKGR